MPVQPSLAVSVAGPVGRVEPSADGHDSHGTGPGGLEGGAGRLGVSTRGPRVIDDQQPRVGQRPCGAEAVGGVRALLKYRHLHGTAALSNTNRQREGRVQGTARVRTPGGARRSGNRPLSRA